MDRAIVVAPRGIIAAGGASVVGNSPSIPERGPGAEWDAKQF